MSIHEHVTTLCGHPVKPFSPKIGELEPDRVIYRFSCMEDTDPFGKRGCLASLFWPRYKARKDSLDCTLNAYLQNPKAPSSIGLVIGMWVESYDSVSAERLVARLAAACEELPNLEILFFGDVTQEESEISWMELCDFTPLLKAFPKLRYFRVRGGGLSWSEPLQHARLETLIVESGGLPSKAVQQVLRADFPELKHLEIWFGDPNYGGDASIADLKPLLTEDRFKKLTYLGLRNCDFTDAVAKEVAKAPALQHLQTLDLSLGTLSDDGAAALAAVTWPASLQKLDLHHHFVSDKLQASLRSLPFPVNLKDVQEADEDDTGKTYRFVAVGE